MTDKLVFKLGTFGLSIGRDFVKPQWERWGDYRGGYWYMQAFGLTVWRDTLPPMTVGERGVW